MTERDRLAAAHMNVLSTELIFALCEGPLMGVRSWIVQTTGMRPIGRACVVGENIRSAETLAAALLSPAILHRRSNRSHGASAVSNPGTKPISSKPCGSWLEENRHIFAVACAEMIRRNSARRLRA